MLNKQFIENYILNNDNKIKINSKYILKNDIFIALQGEHFHGNDFIEESIKKGVKFCITDKKITTKLHKNKIYKVKNIFLFLKKLSIKKRKLFKGKVIGITGSAGKTTLKELLSFFLNKKYKVSFSEKSYNNLLGVLISILNINLKSKYAIFELGTNNFGEIKTLVNLTQPSQVLISNIQSTHLENFKNKINIAKEKSDIFNPKYNPKIETLFQLNTNKYENLVNKIAKKNKLRNIITIGKDKNINNYYIESVKQHKQKYLINLSINKKNFSLITKNNISHRLMNLIFCIAFFNFNKLSIKTILQNVDKFKPIVGRGLIFQKQINNFKIKFIDETYNANPDTMKQSIKYFYQMNSKGFDKILILGNMNELGKHTSKFHLQILKFLEKFKFEIIIICGEFFELAISKIKNPHNNYIIKKNEDDLFEYMKSNLNKNSIVMAKCSNNTNVNKFGKKFINLKGSK
ncbi:MAG: hypothetical protein CMP16_00670 [Rickettsiales bacterium]|nr:hypothetical protein [Rickettsiales bacterium]|tara:strand:- start:437 stop:1819 length:1383 start_codon:yes stop_codon:yes gene_type:complete